MPSLSQGVRRRLVTLLSSSCFNLRQHFTNCSRLPFAFLRSISSNFLYISPRNLFQPLFSQTDTCISALRSIRETKTNLSLITRAPSMCWTFPAIALSLSFPESYYKYFKSTSHCQLCSHDNFFYRPQCLVTNCSKLLPAVRFAPLHSIRGPNQFVTDLEGDQYVLNIPSNCIRFYRSLCFITDCSRLLSIVSCAPMTHRTSLQSLSHHNCSRLLPVVAFASLRSIRATKTNLSPTMSAPVRVEHSQQSHYPLSFPGSYHKLFKATFHCQWCSHDCYFYRLQRLITNCSRVLPAVRFASLRRIRATKTNLSLTIRAPVVVVPKQLHFHKLFKATFHWQLCSHDISHLTSATVSSQIVQGYFLLSDFLPFARFVRQKPICHCPRGRPVCVEHPSNCIFFIVLSVLSQVVQGYFPLSVVLPWLVFLPSSASHHKLFKAIPAVRFVYLL